MESIMVVFDFDKTIVDVDTDNWVLDELGFTDTFNCLLSTMPWNSAMDKMMEEIHKQGVTINDVVSVLRRTPIHPRIVPAIKSIHESGCEMKILSDANRFFIETILDHLQLKECFSSIYTNPGFVDAEGRVRILPHHDFTKSSHGCTCSLCPPNMCKGNVMEKLLLEHGSKKFIYLGDGNGDYCPSLKLRDTDIVMPRKNFPLWNTICADPKLMRAKVHEWADGAELESVLLHLIDPLSGGSCEENDVKIAVAAATAVTKLYVGVDCKFEAIPTTSHEKLPQAMRVPN